MNKEDINYSNESHASMESFLRIQNNKKLANNFFIFLSKLCNGFRSVQCLVRNSHLKQTAGKRLIQYRNNFSLNIPGIFAQQSKLQQLDVPSSFEDLS